MRINNAHSSKLQLPKILGYEFAGKLAQVGEEAMKKGFKVGDKVVALNKTNYGGLAEQCTANISVSIYLTNFFFLLHVYYY